MKIVLGSDHAGYELKETIKKHLVGKGHDIIDVGTDSINSCDYPTFAQAAANEILNGNCALGILCCGTGEGISIAANKVKGIRCGIGYADEVSALIRQHNNANMIAFGARFMQEEDVLRRVDIFLSTDFEGGRHERRVNLIEK